MFGLWGNVLVLFAALAVLAKASDVAINNSVKVADVTGFGRTTIGFIMVAFSTSLPELLVSVFASIRQEAVGVAVGNVLGSNIANICLILGLCFRLVILKCPKYACLYPSMTRKEVKSLYFGLSKDECARVLYFQDLKE